MIVPRVAILIASKNTPYNQHTWPFFETITKNNRFYKWNTIYIRLCVQHSPCTPMQRNKTTTTHLSCMTVAWHCRSIQWIVMQYAVLQNIHTSLPFPHHMTQENRKKPHTVWSYTISIYTNRKCMHYMHIHSVLTCNTCTTLFIFAPQPAVGNQVEPAVLK